MTVLDRVTLRRVRWLPLLLTILAGPFVASGVCVEWTVAAGRWVRAAFVLGRETQRERQRAG